MAKKAQGKGTKPASEVGADPSETLTMKGPKATRQVGVTVGDEHFVVKPNKDGIAEVPMPCVGAMAEQGFKPVEDEKED